MKRIFSIITAVLMTVVFGSSVVLAEENVVYPSELNAGRYEIEAAGSHSELILLPKITPEFYACPTAEIRRQKALRFNWWSNSLKNIRQELIGKQ